MFQHIAKLGISQTWYFVKYRTDNIIVPLKSLAQNGNSRTFKVSLPYKILYFKISMPWKSSEEFQELSRALQGPLQTLYQKCLSIITFSKCWDFLYTHQKVCQIVNENWPFLVYVDVIGQFLDEWHCDGLVADDRPFIHHFLGSGFFLLKFQLLIILWKEHSYKNDV